MSQIKFEPPGKDAPGFLRRMKIALELRQEAARGMSPEVVDRFIEFLLPYVTEPEDRKEAVEALWDATEEQFDMMVNMITGGAENPT
jgi:hypothetical protein